MFPIAKIGDDRCGELCKKTEAAFPDELRQYLNGPAKNGWDSPWFVGWKVHQDFIGTCCWTERHDKGYISQWVMQIPNGELLSVDLPDLSASTCEKGGCTNVPQFGVSADIDAESLRFLIRSGYDRLLDVAKMIAKARAEFEITNTCTPSCGEFGVPRVTIAKGGLMCLECMGTLGVTMYKGVCIARHIPGTGTDDCKYKNEEYEAPIITLKKVNSMDAIGVKQPTVCDECFDADAFVDLNHKIPME